MITELGGRYTSIIVGEKIYIILYEYDSAGGGLGRETLKDNSW